MSSSADEDEHQHAVVEVIMPEADPHAVSSSAASASSVTQDVASLIEKAIAKLPPDLAEQAKDVKRKARSSDPGWKYGWWPDPAKKEFVQCIFCRKVVPSGIKRFKQHLSGGYGDAVGCPHSPELIKREMDAYLKKNSRTVLVQVPDEGDGGVDEEGDEEEVPGQEPRPVPSSGTKIKQAKRKIAQAAITSFIVAAPVKPQTQKHSKSVAALLCKTPEEVVAERHKSKTSQPSLEQCTKKSKEAKQVRNTLCKKLESGTWSFGHFRDQTSQDGDQGDQLPQLHLQPLHLDPLYVRLDSCWDQGPALLPPW